MRNYFIFHYFVFTLIELSHHNIDNGDYLIKIELFRFKFDILNYK